MNVEKSVENFLKGINESTKAYFVGSTLENPLEYKVGDEIVFKIRVKTADEYIDVPYISTEISGDDGQSSKGMIKKSDDGWFYISTKLERDGFVHVIARACDSEQKAIPNIDIFEGGAGADIEKIVCGTPVPEDYFEHWAWLKSEVEKVEPEVIYEKELFKDGYPDYRFFDMRIKVNESNYASVIVSYPKNAKEGTLKLKMQYRGYGIGGIGEVLVAEDTMWIINNAHAIPNSESEEFYEQLKKTENENKTDLYRYGFREDQNDDPKTAYWAKMFLRNLQAFRYFKNHPLLNKKDYIFAGGSQGAMQACNMAAHTPEATFCDMFVPWFCDLGARVNFKRLTGWFPEYQKGITYYDTAVAGQFVKCPVSFGAGLGDYVCPPSGQMALYNGIKTEKKLWFIQNKTHAYTPLEPITYTVNY